MATRARIGLQLKDGSILSVYHHWDGYPQWLGRILETHYDNRSKVSELIDGGDMSSCWTKDRWTGKQVAPYVIEQKEAEEYGPQYYSQRGEDCPPKLDKNLDEFLSDGEEYAYVYSSYTGWKAYDTKSWSDTFKQQVDIPYGELAV
jgi:hypothetical protein